jgi:FlaA1/EpsC-like NDP-sugar epimerase
LKVGIFIPVFNVEKNIAITLEKLVRRIQELCLRPGEKLYEELLEDNEAILPTPHAKLGIAQGRQVDVLLQTELLAWLNQHPALSDEQVKIGLAKWVPEYSRKEAGSDR